MERNGLPFTPKEVVGVSSMRFSIEAYFMSFGYIYVC